MAKDLEKSKHEVKAAKIIEELTGMKAQAEYKFHPTRRWRFDFAFPDQMIAIEIEGGVWSGGRHIHPAGFEADCVKYNTATSMGWKVYRVPSKFVTYDYLSELLCPD